MHVPCSAHLFLFHSITPKILKEQQTDYTEKVHKVKGKVVLVHVIMASGVVEYGSILY